MSKNFYKTFLCEISPHWKKTVLSNKSTIKNVLKNLNNSGLRISLITDLKDKFIGTVTDGDIRRAIINGVNLNNKVEKIVNKNAISINYKKSSELALNLMLKNKIQQVPILSDNQKIIGLYTINRESIFKKIPNTMFIMAGGRGSRLGGYTKNIPKPLLKINGKPMLEHIIERAKEDGFENFIISIHYLGSKIKDYFGNGSNWNIRIKYINEKYPLGTAGSLKLIFPKPQLPIVVTNCDIVTDLNYSDLLNFHNQHQASATMAVRKYEFENPFAAVQTNGIDLIGLEEKPVYQSIINAGIYVLKPSVIGFIKKNENIDMPILFERFIKKNLKTIIFPIHEQWLDIGRPEDFKKINN